jgi:hypothetical protein
VISGARLFRAGLFLALLVVGMYLLLKPPKLAPEPPPPTAEIGVIQGSGAYWLRQNGDLFFREVNGAVTAHELQTLRVPTGTQLQVELLDGGHIQIGENTLAILDRTDSGYEILLFEGSAQVLEQGPSPIAVIHSKLREWSQDEVTQSEQLSQPEPEVAESVDRQTPEILGGRLSDTYIQEVLGRQQRFLRSCFIKYFQRKNGQIQSGRVVLSLYIENSGKVQSTNVVSSDIDDEGYLSCLQSVALRTRFRAFEGAPLSIQYPIDLSL